MDDALTSATDLSRLQEVSVLGFRRGSNSRPFQRLDIPSDGCVIPVTNGSDVDTLAHAGFPLDFFPVLFAVPRVVGWLAHWRQVRPARDRGGNTWAQFNHR